MGVTQANGGKVAAVWITKMVKQIVDGRSRAPPAKIWGEVLDNRKEDRTRRGGLKAITVTK